jgi:hypothetical protein
MIPRFAISRRTVVVFALTLGAGLGLLTWLGSREESVRAYSLGVPFDRQAASVSPNRGACEGPMQIPAEFGGVRAFAHTTGGRATLDLSVLESRTRRVLARGRSEVPSSFTPVTATLTRAVAAGQRVTVCLTVGGPGRILLNGSNRSTGSIPLRVAGKPVSHEVSLVFLASRRRSLLSQIPTMFARASLFRPGWVGAWSFWALAVLLLFAAVALVIAVSRAALEDERG